MTTMLVLTGDLDTALVASEVTLHDRMLARCRASRWDRELAAGVSPETSVVLAVRAQVLVSPRHRRHLADSLSRLLADCGRPVGRSGTLLPMVQRQRIRDCAETLGALIARLRAAGPVSSRGVARIGLLLCDGAGPLYRAAGDDGCLRHDVEAALCALEPLADW
jgi:hypothetical protein